MKENKNWKLVNFCEFDKYAAKSYCAIHNVDESKNLGDITKVDENELEDFNMICGGSPCFVAGTKVYTSDGYKNIEDVKIGDMVLTHKNRFKKVLRTGTNKNKEVYKIKAQGIFDTIVTENHPYYIREKKYVWDNDSKRYKRHFSDPIWKEVHNISKGDFIGIPIMSTSENIKNLTKEECYLIGRYVADGYIRNGKRPNRDNSYNHQVIFCMGKHKIDDFKNHINKSGYYFGINEERTVFKARIINEHFMNLCIECGKGAENKTIPYWILNLPIDYLKEFLEGYMSGDGCFTNGNYKATSVSKELIGLLGLCVMKCYKIGFRIYHTKRKPKTVIEGRTVNQKDTYEIVFTKDIRKQKKYEIIEDIVWFPVKDISKLELKTEVYNIEVEEDNSYTANNAIVHNCQDFSISGKQKGSVWTCEECFDEEGKPFEYNPLTVHWSKRDKCPKCGSSHINKTRSSLLVEYLRVVRANKPNFGIYENVKNIVGKKFRDTTFKLFTDELEEYGYNVYWQVLNAKDYGIPQNRERVYLIFIKKDLDNGKFKFPEPFDNGLRLKDLLEDEVDEKFYISDEKVKRFIPNFKINDEKSIDYDVPRFIGNVNRPDFGTGYAGCVWDSKYISPTLTTMQGGGRQPHILTGLVKNKGEEFVKQTDCANTLLARDYKDFGNQEMNCVVENRSPKERFFKQAIETLEKNECKPGDTINAFNKHVDKSGYSPTLTTRPEGFKTAILPVTNNIRIRKLTPKECFRLMDFSDENFYAAKNAGISNSQLYKQAGNSIVTDVLYYIYVELYKAMPYLFDDLKLSSFFSGIGAFEIALDRLYEGINSGNFTNPQVE